MTELTILAKNLARNCGYHVFPCNSHAKMPAWSKRQGGRGFHDATTEPAEIARLFRHPRADLVGIRTGGTGGVSVLDIDVKHDAARAWWIKNESRLPATRTFRTRSGGLHLYFQHADGVRNVEGKPVQGIDVRGEGGYVISWFAVGFPCVDHALPAPWPNWLTTLFWPQAPEPASSRLRLFLNLEAQTLSATGGFDRIKDCAIARVREAGEGLRHHRLRSSARLLGGIQRRAGFTDATAIEWLTNAAGLRGEKKASETVEWGLAKGREQPLELRSA